MLKMAGNDEDKANDDANGGQPGGVGHPESGLFGLQPGEDLPQGVQELLRVAKDLVTSHQRTQSELAQLRQEVGETDNKNTVYSKHSYIVIFRFAVLFSRIIVHYSKNRKAMSLLKHYIHTYIHTYIHILYVKLITVKSLYLV